MLEVYLVSFKSNIDWTVWREDRVLVTWSMNQGDSVALQDNERFLRKRTRSRILNLNRHLSSISRDFIAEEALWKLPVTRLRVASVCVAQEAMSIVIELFADWSLFHISQGDAIRMAVEDELVLRSVPVT